jgi:hypothetical protein
LTSHDPQTTGEEVLQAFLLGLDDRHGFPSVTRDVTRDRLRHNVTLGITL